MRSQSTAASMSPAVSVSADLQSIMPAPVLSRSSLTIAAEMLIALVPVRRIVARLDGRLSRRRVRLRAWPIQSSRLMRPLKLSAVSILAISSSLRSAIWSSRVMPSWLSFFSSTGPTPVIFLRSSAAPSGVANSGSSVSLAAAAAAAAGQHLRLQRLGRLHADVGLVSAATDGAASRTIGSDDLLLRADVDAGVALRRARCRRSPPWR